MLSEPKFVLTLKSAVLIMKIHTKIPRRNEMSQELVIVLDFGGQYNQLVARRVRECNVYCEIYSYRTDIQKIKDMNPKGIILT